MPKFDYEAHGFAAPIAPTAPQKRSWWVWLLATVLVLLPLPFGTNRAWASDLFGLLCGVMLLGLAWDLKRFPDLWPRGGPVKRVMAAASLLVLIAIWVFLQTQSWMPQSWHHPLWADVKFMPGALAGSIAVDPDRMPESLVRIFAYAACFFLAFFAGRLQGSAQMIVKALAVAAVIYAVYGMLMQSTGLCMILWYDKWAYREFVTSTFVNKNSYATYAGIGLQLCLALLWQSFKRKPKVDPTKSSDLTAFIEKFGTRDVFYLLMSVIVLGALILTGSRAGMASTLMGCVAFLLALAVNRRWKLRRWLPVLVVGILLLAGFLTFSDTMLIDRLGGEQLELDTPVRLNAYAIEWRAILSNPWLGFGLGGFENAFRLYRDPTQYLWFEHAHNDYLETLMELGVPMALAMLAMILLPVSICLGGIRNRKRQEIFSILAVSVTVTVACHALADFSLQIPAVAGTYAALLGLGVAQSWSTREKSGRSSKD